MTKMTKVARAVALLGVTGGLMSAAWADDASTDTTKIEKIQVTGSNIKRLNVETASPIQVISKKEIQDMGATTVMEILQKATSITSNLSDISVSNSFAEGGSGVALRNLGKHATLVLLDGHRLAPFALADGAQETFTNIDALPTDAIERIEILKDGASSIYGSDAMAGVINVITRKNYTGFEANGSMTKSQRVSAAGSQDASVTLGWGDLDVNHFNIFGSVSMYHRDQVQEADVLNVLDKQYYKRNPATGTPSSYSNPGNLELLNPDGSVGGLQAAPGCSAANLNTKTGLCTFPRWNYINVTPKTDRFNSIISAHYDLGSDISGYTQLTTSDIKYSSPLAVPTFNSGQTYYLTNWNNPTQAVAPLVIPYLSATNPLNNTGSVVGLRYRFNDDPSMFKDTAHDKEYRLLSGLKGTFAGWDWESSVTAAESQVDQTQTGRVSGFSVAGFNSLFGPYATDPATGLPLMNDHSGYVLAGQNSSSVLSTLFPTLHNRGTSKEQSFDVTVSRPILQLGGGDMSIALGYQLRHDSLEENYDPLAKAGGITDEGIGIDLSGSQTVNSVYAELAAPITKKLEADAAVRVDKYSQFEAAVTPKFGIKYQALDSLLLRSTYAEGFRAPNIAESGKGTVAGYNTVNDPLRCPVNGQMLNILNQTSDPYAQSLALNLNDCQISAPGGSTPNPNLKPEKSHSVTLGVVFEPSKSFNISMDYFLISRKDEIALQNAQLVANAGVTSSGPYAGQLTRFPTLQPNDIALNQLIAKICASAASQASYGVTSGCPAPGGQPIAFAPNQTGIYNLTAKYMNFGKTLTDGVDIDVNGRLNLGDWGKLHLGFEGTYTARDSAFQQGIGPNGGDAWGVNQRGHYATPAWRAVASADWDYRALHLGTRVNYTSPQDLWNDTTDTTWNRAGCQTAGYAASTCNDGVASWTTVDLSAAYTGVKNLTLTMNVLNVFARKPWYDAEAGTSSNNNGSLSVNQFENYDGRIYKVGIGYKFF
ncbi:MAG: TonB-dependent receptor [Burkholderiales bacterium]|nr:TonB-dependent receptor [Burkholderiales bacterium]